TEQIGRESHVAELRHHARSIHGMLAQTEGLVHDQHSRSLAGPRILMSEKSVARQRAVGIAHVHGLDRHFCFSSECSRISTLSCVRYEVAIFQSPASQTYVS